MIKLKYGNTNTFYIQCNNSGLLIDTDYAGTLSAFYQAIKAENITLRDIKYVLATHYHPDHIGLVSILMKLGVKLLLIDVQAESVHFADKIFARERHLGYTPIDESQATIISLDSSRAFLQKLSISGEIIHTPSHSEDSISVILDNGDCFVGDLEPVEYLSAYDNNTALEQDWHSIMSRQPRRIFYAHANEKIL